MVKSMDKVLNTMMTVKNTLGNGNKGYSMEMVSHIIQMKNYSIKVNGLMELRLDTDHFTIQTQKKLMRVAGAMVNNMVMVLLIHKMGIRYMRVCLLMEYLKVMEHFIILMDQLNKSRNNHFELCTFINR